MPGGQINHLPLIAGDPDGASDQIDGHLAVLGLSGMGGPEAGGDGEYG